MLTYSPFTKYKGISKKEIILITESNTPNKGESKRKTITEPPAVPAEPKARTNLNNLLLNKFDNYIKKIKLLNNLLVIL